MTSNHSIRFYSVEKLTFLYILVTSLIILFLSPGVHIARELLGARIIMVSIIFCLAYLNSIKNWMIIRFSRFAFVGVLLVYWYPETFDINRMLPNFDHLLAGLEQKIFGFQPALVFNQLYPQHWISELLNMGYFAYYPLIVGTSAYLFFKDRKFFEYFFFTVLFAFFCYYIIYILFPTAGPQYYFQAIGLDQVHAGNFPQVGYYFDRHQELLPACNNSGVFSQMVQNTQQVGERPTAAFPSSHVGISTLILILIIKNRRYLYFSLLFPIYMALVAATVYIQAHYLIDVIAGFVTAFGFYYLGSWVYKEFTRKFVGIPELSSIFLKQPIKVRNM